MIELLPTRLEGVIEARPKRLGDNRGFFSEIWRRDQWAQFGIEIDWVQDNHSMSREGGVLRGLHYQVPPAHQSKLVRVTAGRILDVVVDIRRSSPSFCQWIAVELSAELWNQLLVPAGFAHGFLTLEPDTQVQYKVSSYFSPDHDRAIRWNDPALGIDWAVNGMSPTLSAKDAAAPLMADAELFV